MKQRGGKKYSKSILCDFQNQYTLVKAHDTKVRIYQTKLVHNSIDVITL